MKSASGKRHPGEKHSPGEETNRPQQRIDRRPRSAESREKKVGTAFCSATACAYSASAGKDAQVQEMISFFVLFSLYFLFSGFPALKDSKAMEFNDAEKPAPLRIQ